MYHKFTDDTSQEYGSFEVFYMSDKECQEGNDMNPDYPIYDGKGWYWWSCWPGCLPDSEPSGPFQTEAEAIADANQAEVTY